MLLNNFFQIKTISGNDSTVNAIIIIDAKHIILDGHFPGMPIVPGVCMVQIIKETMEHYLQVGLSMVMADYVKFINVIIPTQVNIVDFNASYSKNDHEVKVVSELSKDGIIYFKMKERFIIL